MSRKLLVFYPSHIYVYHLSLSHLHYVLLFSLIPITILTFVSPIVKFFLAFSLPLTQYRQISEYNIKMGLQEVG